MLSVKRKRGVNPPKGMGFSVVWCTVTNEGKSVRYYFIKLLFQRAEPRGFALPLYRGVHFTTFFTTFFQKNVKFNFLYFGHQGVVNCLSTTLFHYTCHCSCHIKSYHILPDLTSLPAGLFFFLIVCFFAFCQPGRKSVKLLPVW